MTDTSMALIIATTARHGAELLGGHVSIAFLAGRLEQVQSSMVDDFACHLQGSDDIAEAVGRTGAAALQRVLPTVIDDARANDLAKLVSDAWRRERD
ncbi:hypothetical protein [Streptomyces sp. SM12]|uniref:hypothetical protein n=1 Tax=Streptomyces sp. SM12 TaxID=1071602 RepID=UPI000CD4E03F|nr:hypothetical protein [Streptomyces sp. SM12]